MRTGWLLPLCAVTLALLSGCAGRHDAPPIFAPQLENEQDQDFLGISVRFSGALKRQFPVGSSDGALRSILESQGFEFLSSTSAVYLWRDLACERKVSITWVADDYQRITRVEGSYYGSCI
jgi:hypothetical protein